MNAMDMVKEMEAIIKQHSDLHEEAFTKYMEWVAGFANAMIALGTPREEVESRFLKSCMILSQAGEDITNLMVYAFERE